MLQALIDCDERPLGRWSVPVFVIEPASMESVFVLARPDAVTGCVFTCTHSPCVNLTLAVPSASFFFPHLAPAIINHNSN